MQWGCWWIKLNNLIIRVCVCVYLFICAHYMENKIATLWCVCANRKWSHLHSIVNVILWDLLTWQVYFRDMKTQGSAITIATLICLLSAKKEKTPNLLSFVLPAGVLKKQLSLFLVLFSICHHSSSGSWIDTVSMLGEKEALHLLQVQNKVLNLRDKHWEQKGVSLLESGCSATEMMAVDFCL